MPRYEDRKLHIDNFLGKVPNNNGGFKPMELRATLLHVTPSWKRFGEGTAVARVSVHPEGEWISFDMEETALRDPHMPNSRDVSKRAMISLDRPYAEKLYQMLKLAFEPEPKHGI